MLLRAIGALLPAALGVALNPFPVIAVVLLLARPNGRRGGAAFAVGWVIGLTALTTVAVLVVNSTEEADGTSSVLVDWLRVAVGVLMILWAIKKGRTRRRTRAEAVLPGWMAGIAAASPSRAFAIGVGLSGVNPKNFALAMSAAASITDLTVAGDDTLIAAVVFVVLGSLSVLGIVGFHVVGGARAVAPLEGVKRFMIDNNAVLIMMVLLILGVKILGDGLGALGS